MKAIIEDGYIIVIGNNVAGKEITDEYAAQIMQALNNVPAPENGYGYRLNENLMWERYIIPIEPEPDEPTTEDKAEAYDILMGVNE